MNNKDTRPAVFILLLAVFFLLLLPITLREPYHIDTSSYMTTVKHFNQTNEVRSFFPVRPLAGYTFLLFSFAFGEYVLPAVALLTGFLCAVFYFLWLRRYFDNIVSFLSILLVFTIPAGLVTVTHLKEDFISFMHVAIALLLISDKKIFRGMLSGVFLGLSVLTKESSIIFIPFCLLYIYLIQSDFTLNKGALFDKGVWLKFLKVSLGALGLFLLTVFVVKRTYFHDVISLTGSLYTEKTMPPSEFLLSVVLPLWIFALGSVLFWAQFTGAGLLYIARREKFFLLYLLMFLQFILLVLLVSGNVTIKYRHFLFTSAFSFPLMLEFMRRVSKRYISIKWAKILLLVFVLAIAVFNAGKVIPAAYMRARYNPVRWFYESIPFDQEKFLLLAMDESKHIVYFTDFEVLRHSINPDLDETARLKEAIDARMSGGTEVYVAPGFFTSDKAHNIRTMIGENYDLMPVYENWFENHYRISLGLPLREVVDYCRRQCDPKNALVKTKKEDRSSPLVTYEIVMEYEDGESEVYYTVGLLGRAMSSIVREVVFRLRPREL